MIKLQPDDIERMASRVSQEAEYIIQREIEVQLHDFEQYCESPIEAYFGAALHFAANSMGWARARAKLLYLNEPDRSRRPLLPAQWELVPQFKWENYRIDFAVFTELPNPIFIECDGHDFHERTKEQAAHDRGKDRRIQAAGIPVLRFTGSQIYADPVGCGYEVYRFIYQRLDLEATK